MRSSRRMYQLIESSWARHIFAMAVAQLPPPIIAILPGNFICMDLDEELIKFSVSTQLRRLPTDWSVLIYISC